MDVENTSRPEVDRFLDDEILPNLTDAYLGVPKGNKKNSPNTLLRIVVVSTLVGAAFVGGVFTGQNGKTATFPSDESHLSGGGDIGITDIFDNETLYKMFLYGDSESDLQDILPDASNIITEDDMIAEVLEYDNKHPVIQNMMSDEEIAQLEEEINEHEAALQILQNSEGDEDFDFVLVDSDDDDLEELSYELPEARRNLMGGMMVYNEPLTCNENLETANCTSFSTALSSKEAGVPFVVGCGKCYEVDIADGTTEDFPDGLIIEGKLYFPSSSSVVIKTKFVHVFGLLTIDPPSTGKKVKFSLYQEDQTSAIHPDENSKCGHGCNMGSKAIAVLGGKLDIRGYNSTCPTWEKLSDLVPTENLPYDMPRDGESGEQLALTVAGACKESPGHTTATGKYVVYCPVKENVTISYGVGTNLKFTSMEPLPPEDFIMPEDSSGTSLDLKVKRNCGWSGGHTDALNKCTMYCEIEETADIPFGHSMPLSFTSVKPTTTQFDMPCDAEDNCVTLTVRGPCSKSVGHSDAMGIDTVHCPIETTGNVGSGSRRPLKFVNEATGAELIASEGVHHWAWVGQHLFFFPDQSDADVNAMFPVGSTMTVQPHFIAPGGQTFDLSGVHHWAWARRHIYFFPSGYSKEECSQAASDFNVMFPAEYGITVNNRNEVPSPNPAGDSFITNGVMHWAWVGKYLYFYPENILDTEIATMFPTGYRIQVSHVEPQYKHIQVSKDAASCWGPGTEMLLTSNTRSSNGGQEATVVDSDPDTGIITLDRFIDKPLTLVDHPDFAIEVASLTRPVIFEAESDASNSVIGGHLIIHHTQVGQHLEGVEIRNFGQQGRLGRYPVHFHMCDDSPQSVVRRNVVRDSNQRGYVMHMTNEVTVENNVAYNVVGHCYFLEAGTEQGTTFDRNLGALVKRMSQTSVNSLSASSGRTETDTSASAFWISNPNNTFTNNLVAGAEAHGYWFETKVRTERENGNLVLFENNTAHSCDNFAFQSYPPGWRPSEANIIKNLKIYRNRHWGAFLHVTRNLHFVDGIFADNGERAIMINRGDNITFEGTKFIGKSGLNGDTHCWSGQVGISLLPFKLQEFDQSGTIRGATVLNAEFYNWTESATSCPGSTSMIFRTDQVFTPSYTASHYFENVKLDDPTSQVDACIIENEIGIDQTIIEICSDIHNAYSPTGVSGFLASPKVTTMLDEGACIEYNSCLKFCENTCFRTVTFRTDASRENINMTVTNLDDNTKSLLTGPVYRSDQRYDSRFDAHFTVALPYGNYAVKFNDVLTGEHVWPGYVRPVFETPPTCANYVTDESFTILKPEASRESCNDIINNGNFESSIESWQAYVWHGWSFEWRDESGGALKTIGRTDSGLAKITQWLDGSCIQAEDTYEIMLSYRYVDPTNTACPTLGISSFVNWAEQWHSPGVATQCSDDVDGFKTISGHWTVTEYQAAANAFRLWINQGTGDLIINNVQMKKVTYADVCSKNQIVNGDAEEGTSSNWWGWGNEVGVESPGYGDSNYALKAYNRNRWVRGMHNNNMKDLGCFKQGDTWRVTFKTRMYNQFDPSIILDCTPSDMGYDCPMLRLHTMHTGATLHKFHEIRDPDMVWDATGGWSTFNTTFTITESMVETFTLYRFMIVGGAADSVLLLDDIEFYLVSSIN